jgi:methionine salvage enolase-phosphatase E1
MSLFIAGIDARAALLSIEGVISSRSHLHSTVTWYARQRLPEFIAQHAGEPAAASTIAGAAFRRPTIRWSARIR